MGWLKIKQQHILSLTHVVNGIDEAPSSIEDIKPSTQHIEFVTPTPQTSPRPRPQRYPFAHIETPDNDLTFISASEVKARRSRTGDSQTVWIVIDNIVYDCSDFRDIHPGGDTVINSFNGSDCSWQFWRFHGKQHLEEPGRRLRIGRTQKVENRFKEPRMYVGLGRLGDDD